MLLSMLLVTLRLTACTLSSSDTGDSAYDPGRNDSHGHGDVCCSEGTDAGDVPGVTVMWSGDGLAVDIANGTSSYSLGMAQTGAGASGWFGEDCLPGTVEGSGDYDICHDAVPATGLTLQIVGTPEEVVANESTLFQGTMADTITYVLANNASGYCWTFGHEPNYYADLACGAI